MYLLQIDSAPRDGTPILVYQAGKGIGDCGFVIVYWMAFLWNDFTITGWFDAQQYEYSPTYWMPLPDVP